MYDSPIKVDFTEPVIEKLKDEADQYIIRACQKINVDVDREGLIRALRYDRGQYFKGYRDAVDEVQPSGKWVMMFDSDEYPARTYWLCCSICGHIAPFGRMSDIELRTNFCPNCGADMREGS